MRDGAWIAQERRAMLHAYVAKDEKLQLEMLALLGVRLQRWEKMAADRLVDLPINSAQGQKK